MKRRDLVKRIGTAGLLVGAATRPVAARGKGSMPDDRRIRVPGDGGGVTVSDDHDDGDCILEDCSDPCPVHCTACLC